MPVIHRLGLMLVLLLALLLTTNTHLLAATAPLILYTDALSGPTSGGEGNQGAYLSIFGKGFGTTGLGTTTKVYIGSAEVANYRYLGASRVAAKLGIQQLIVQVGSLGGAAVNTALPVRVEVGGVPSNTEQTFTPCAGRILFVALGGQDSTAVAGDITKPWRYLQNMTTASGAYFAMGVGDQVVLRGGNWSDTNGADTTWMRAGSGSMARNGTAKAWIHITAYPGPISGNAPEDVHYTTPAGKSGGIAGPWSAIAGTSGEYWSISNLRMEVAGGAARDAAPLNFQYTAGPWRVTNNELGPWIAGSSSTLNGAGISGHGDGNRILGNHIHDIEGTSELQNHGIYADSLSMNWEVSFNWIHDISGGSLVQFNDNEGFAGSVSMPHGSLWQGFTGMRVHHNWLQNAAKYGIHYNDQGSVKLGTYEGQHWNNVIIGTKFPPLRINSTQPIQHLWFAYNTIYDCMTVSSGTGNGYVRSEGWGTGTDVHNIFYDNIFSFGANTVAGTKWFADAGGIAATTSTFDFKRNLYFANGQTPAAPSTIGDALAVIGNPLFTNAGSADFTLQATSPARDAGTQALPAGFSPVSNDFTGVIVRPQGGTPDLGAFEYAASGGDTTAPSLSAISAGSVTAIAATITWTTNEAATTQVEYGTTTAYGASTTLVASLVTAHSQSISGLSAGTIYHYRVKSSDAAGNAAVSADRTFTTLVIANHPPVAAAQALTTARNTAKTITLAATDADGDALTYRIVTPPSHGQLSGTGAARIYTPTAGYTGSDVFSFAATDGTVDSNTAVVSITVSGSTLSWSTSQVSVADTVATCLLSVTRSGTGAGAVSVVWATSASGATAVAGTDYTAASGALNWADGDTAAKTVTITLHNAVHAFNVAFPVVLSVAGGGATLGTTTSFVSMLESSLTAVGLPWAAQDIGSVLAIGSTHVITGGSNVYTLAGSGGDIWGGTDAFHYLSQPMTGDGRIEVHVVSQTNTDGWAKAGLMFRDTLTPGSLQAAIYVTPSRGVIFQYRTAASGSSGSIAGPAKAAPEWLRVVRSGTVFTGYASPDGVTWTQVGHQTVTMGSSINVGLAVCSHRNGMLSVAQFDHVLITPTASN